MYIPVTANPDDSSGFYSTLPAPINGEPPAPMAGGSVLTWRQVAVLNGCSEIRQSSNMQQGVRDAEFDAWRTATPLPILQALLDILLGTLLAVLTP